MQEKEIMQVTSILSFSNTVFKSRVFHDSIVSLNFEGFDPQFFLNDPKNLLFCFCDSYERVHSDPLNGRLKENPAKGFLFQDP